MNDTKQRIAEYTQLLPRLKERIIAVALLLVISLSMVTTTTLAWVVLSRNPEVAGVTTTVASNGNLEIALVAPDGSAPGASRVGDSFATSGQSITAANLTWGNMINLNDPSYGLDNLVLRPAQLNKASLLISPLYGAEYGEDGRITQLNSNFAYTMWVPPDEDTPGYFGVTTQYGVRAISSTKMDVPGGQEAYYNFMKKVEGENLAAANAYTALGNNDKYMPSLATMMGLYMTARMNPSDATLSNPTCEIADIENLRDMYAAFLQAMDLEATAMADLLNFQMFIHYGAGEYTPLTGEDILALTQDKLNALGTQKEKNWTPVLTRWKEFVDDYNTIQSDWVKLSALVESGTSLKWKDSGMNDIVNNLVDVGKCTIGADNTPISSIGASNAVGYLSGTQEARITNGILYRFEERTGGYIEVKNLGISATVKRSGITVPATVRANIQTTAPRDNKLFENDWKAAQAMYSSDSLVGAVAVAQDTFGLAVDFWVRTNATAHYLVLEGNVLTEPREERATGKDPSGNIVELYTLTRPETEVTYELYLIETESESTASDGKPKTIQHWYNTANGEEVYVGEDETPTKTDKTYTVGENTYDVYTLKRTNPATSYDLYQIKDSEEKITWYNAETHSVFTLEEGEKPAAKMITVEYVIGYEGENRVWNRDDSANQTLTINSTTQGSGSCYVFYADTPEDQARSMELLKAMKVAFVDEDGKLMASAYMDTEHFYADNGKVIVPLVLNSGDSLLVGETTAGESVYGITALEKNVATRVTAIVYLDGTQLTNDQVLAAADIQGQLNIQFGAYTDDLDNADNEELQNKELNVSATVSQTEFDYDTATDPMTTTVTVRVDGDQPKNVTAFFIRAINSTQGSREKEITFTSTGNGDWTADYTFEVPGTYIIRSVFLDGVEYDLKSRPAVTVKGFTVESLSCAQADNNHITVMTAGGSHTVDLSLKFASNDPEKMPKEVQGRFLRDEDGSAVNINFTYNTNGVWSGTATFLTSGDYTLQFVVLDGEYVELAANHQKTATVYLGMRVAVYTTSPHRFKYIPSEMTDNQKLLGMQIKILDNAGNEMPGLSDVKLTYPMKGSGIKKMDADLTWNGSYYEGELTTDGPGIWVFGSVTVGGENTITNATTSPVFTILSPDPPEYLDYTSAPYQYKPNKDASMTIQISNSSAASVQACFVKNSTEYWVTGTVGSEVGGDVLANYWTFEVPVDGGGYQDGNWQVTTLRLWDVFAADGTEYTQEEPLVIDIGAENIKTKVVNRVTVSFKEGQSANFGKDADDNVIGVFMQSYEISGLEVVIKDFEDQPIKGISNVKLKFTYGYDSRTYGGYTSDKLTNAVADFEIALDDDGTGTRFVQSGSKTLQYAGSWTTTFSFDVSGSVSTYSGDTLPANAPVFTVSSITPSVKVAVDDTTTSFNTKITWSKKNILFSSYLEYTLSEPKTNILNSDKNEVYVYAQATTDSDIVGNGDAGFIHPTLTFTTTGVDSSCSVEFTIPAGSATAKSISITGNATSSPVELGVKGTAYDMGKGTWGVTYTAYSYLGHGDQTISQVTVKRGGITYTVYLEKPIIIHNPSSVNQTS